MSTPAVDIQRVLVATDLDATHTDALFAADRIARAFDAQLGVVTVMPSGFPEHAVSPHRDAAQHAELGAGAERHLRLRSTMWELLGRDGSAFEAFVDRGDAAVEIVRRARRYPADLIVVGSHDRRGIERWILGSVSEQVVRGSFCPVLVARAGGFGPRASVLAACDLAASAPAVVAWAGRFAERLSWPLVAAHVTDLGMTDVTLMATAAFSGGPPPPLDRDSHRGIREAASNAVHAELASCGALGDAEVLSGPIVPAIIDRARARGAGLIVVGTHARTGLARLALGSLAEQIVRKAPCSVLVIH